MKGKMRGVFVLYIATLVLLLGLMFLGYFFYPMLSGMTTSVLDASEDILTDNSGYADLIANQTLKDAIQSSITGAQGSLADQSIILNIMTKYWWAVIGLVLILIVFMYARSQVETEVR